MPEMGVQTIVPDRGGLTKLPFLLDAADQRAYDTLERAGVIRSTITRVTTHDWIGPAHIELHCDRYNSDDGYWECDIDSHWIGSGFYAWVTNYSGFTADAVTA